MTGRGLRAATTPDDRARHLLRALACGALLVAVWILPRADEAHEFDPELARADAAAARIDQEWPTDRLGPVPKLVAEIGARLARGLEPARYPWRFTVVRDRSMNAFSVGAGRVYVTDGAIRECRNEAELAALLAHEMGHQVAGHFRDAPESVDWRSSVWALLGDTRADQQERAIGSLSQHIDPAREREADRLAVDILRAGGYDAHAALWVLERGPALEASSDADASRAAALRAVLVDVPGNGRTDSAEFQVLRRRALGGDE